MTKNQQESDKVVAFQKPMPTFFPLGFSMAVTNDGMVIINFLDQPREDGQRIISSVALTGARAKIFAEQILRSLHENSGKNAK